jgi:hypothetical protein
MCGPGQRAVGEAVPCHGRTRARARVWLEVGDDPDRWVPAVSERKKGKRKECAGWAVLGEAEQAGQLGRAGEKEGKEGRPAGLGRAVGRGEKLK